MVLFTVSAILLPDTLAAAASSGAASISWWLILGVLFLLPFGLIAPSWAAPIRSRAVSTPGCAMPSAAAGPTRITWCYWINVCLWLPAIYILCAGIFNQVFASMVSLAFQIGLAIALTWLTVAVNVVDAASRQVDTQHRRYHQNTAVCRRSFSAPGATCRLNEMANPMTLETMTPRWGEGLQYLPAIIYGMLGFELVSAGAEEMRDPTRVTCRARSSLRDYRDRALPARHRGRPRRRARGGDQPGRGPHRHAAAVLRWTSPLAMSWCALGLAHCSPFSPAA
jgi:hypothetical protein